MNFINSTLFLSLCVFIYIILLHYSEKDKQIIHNNKNMIKVEKLNNNSDNSNHHNNHPHSVFPKSQFF